MHSSWHVLIPPAIVLILSFVTKKVNEALMAGIIAAALIVTNFSLPRTLALIFSRIWLQLSDLDNLYLFGFLLILGFIITLIAHTGGTNVYSRIIKKNVHGKRGVEISSLILSFFFLMDDYFSSLTVGSVMRKITDHYKIPRVKLAFLINAIAPSLAILPPISSWIAMLLSQLTKAGISDNPMEHPLILADPFLVYVRIIPYIFYSFIIIFSTWWIVLNRLSFGLMHEHEVIADKTGNLFGGKQPLKAALQEPEDHKGTIADFFVPIGSLIIAIPCTILYSGNYHLLGGTNGFLESIAQANIFFSLFTGSVIALIISMIYYALQKKINGASIITTFRSGILLMYQSIIILLLATIFTQFLKTDLPAGRYLADSLLGSFPLATFPCLFFGISVIIAMITGSSWGTIMVMIPLAVPMLIEMLGLSTPTMLSQVTMLIPVIGSVLSGAVAGTHLSPIADNMVMSSTSSGSYHIDHVQTQSLYVLPSIIATGVAFLLLGFLHSWSPLWAFIIALTTGIFLSCAFLAILHYREKKKKA